MTVSHGGALTESMSASAHFADSSRTVSRGPRSARSCREHSQQGFPLFDHFVDASGAIVERADLRFMELSASDFLRPNHSGLMPASLMIGPHISLSDASRAASSAGVDTVTGAPMASYLSLTEGCSSAATASARILVAISYAVFSFTNNHHQGD